MKGSAAEHFGSNFKQIIVFAFELEHENVRIRLMHVSSISIKRRWNLCECPVTRSLDITDGMNEPS